MPIPSTASIFNPKSVWCCRCKTAKPLTQVVCQKQVHKTRAIDREEDGRKFTERVNLPEMEACGHRNCESCQWIDEVGDHVRHQIQVPTTWKCGSCDDSGHVLDIIMDTARCDAEEHMGYDNKGRPKKISLTVKRPTMQGVYDQFGKLMAIPPKPFRLQNAAERREAAEFLWSIRGSYWLLEMKKPGTLLQAKAGLSSAPAPLELPPLESLLVAPAKEMSSALVVCTEASDSVGKKQPNKLRKVNLKTKAETGPKPELTMEEKKAAEEARKLQDEKFERMLVKQEEEFAAAAAAKAVRLATMKASSEA